MSRADHDVPELVRAAEALETELVRLETLSRAIRKLRLDSEKSIAKAAKELNEAMAVPERLSAGLQGLAAAMQQMQVRQQAALEPLAASAAEIQQRMQKLGEHLQAFAALGKVAAEVTALLQSKEGDESAKIDRARTELAALGEGARRLFEAARDDGFHEVARDAEALKQRISSLRKRLEPTN
jgi:hypothetical protein